MTPQHDPQTEAAIATELVACTLGQRRRRELQLPERRGMAFLATGPSILLAAARRRAR